MRAEHTPSAAFEFRNAPFDITDRCGEFSVRAVIHRLSIIADRPRAAVARGQERAVAEFQLVEGHEGILFCTLGVCMLCMYREDPMQHATTEKQRTNVTLTAANLAAARELGLNVSAISDAAVAEAVRLAKAKAWAQENASAIEERRTWIETHGTPLADLQVLNID